MPKEEIEAGTKMAFRQDLDRIIDKKGLEGDGPNTDKRD